MRSYPATAEVQETCKKVYERCTVVYPTIHPLNAQKHWRKIEECIVRTFMLVVLYAPARVPVVFGGEGTNHTPSNVRYRFSCAFAVYGIFIGVV